MALYIRGKEITQIFIKNRAIQYVYKGTLLLWQAIQSWSCFGSGYWMDTLTWVDNDTWRDG